MDKPVCGFIRSISLRFSVSIQKGIHRAGYLTLKGCVLAGFQDLEMHDTHTGKNPKQVGVAATETVVEKDANGKSRVHQPRPWIRNDLCSAYIYPFCLSNPLPSHML